MSNLTKRILSAAVLVPLVLLLVFFSSKTVFVSAVSLVEGPSFLLNLVGLGPVFAAAGAGCATGTLAMARRAEDRELLAAGEDVAEVGLTEDEALELLGGRG